MDIAYSIEFQNVIDSEKAYDLFQAGIIKDKRAFECPEENCNAQITCVNIDKPIQERKKSVHFRSYGNHIENCSYGQTLPTKNPNSDSTESDNHKLSNIHILAKRPDDYYTIKELTGTSEQKETEKKNRKREYIKSYDSKSPKRHYWIAPLVSTYLRIENSQELLTNTFIQKESTQIAFSDFFVAINNQEHNELSSYPRIYYDKAYFNTINEDTIEVRFNSHFKIRGNSKRPTVRLSLQSFSEYKNYTYWKKRLKVAIDSKRPYLFFIYGVPSLRQWEKNNDTVIEYIRFSTKKLDFMDLRI